MPSVGVHMNEATDFGLSSAAARDLRRVFDSTPGIERVWIFGSRARGQARANSDIDLAVDAPDWGAEDMARLERRLEQLLLLYKLDAVHWQAVDQPVFRQEIERDRQLFWAPRVHAAKVEAVGGIALKEFQADVLEQLGRYLDELKKHAAQSQAAVQALRAMEGMEDAAREVADFPKKSWAALKARALLPAAFAEQPYSSRFDGAGRASPNVCFKVPTGGGKTLLAAASVARVFSSYLNRHTGLVLWVVPNDAIYRQTLKALGDRDHPYRQILNVAGAGRVKVLEKGAPLSRMDVASHLCVMVLMLQSAARQSKETLKVFRDRGNVLGYLPREDDIEAHWDLLQRVPNLDVYAPWGKAQEGARAQKGSIVKSSLGNVLRLLQPMVVIDEGHHGYTENALRTLDGFNPAFLLELSATPRVASTAGKTAGSGSNILVDIRGVDLEKAHMIKLPIHVDVRQWKDWQSCLAASVAQLDQLQHEAQLLRSETARYIRPILLVQVERTGADLRDAGFIHAEDARAYLLQLGFSEKQIAVKTSEKDELRQPENIDLLASACEVRAIITKQALQEGWDCPFAYVLCALAAGRNPAAMTQLVGRILRQPQVTKTGRDALDACYVLCNDATTGAVVKAVKKSLEGEGMGDLAIKVRGEGGEATDAKSVTLKRRPGLANLRIFLPKVTWVDPGIQATATAEQRRELVYESDVLAHVPWDALDVSRLAAGWAPGAAAQRNVRLELDLSVLDDDAATALRNAVDCAPLGLDRARIVRALLDLAPNAWCVWSWVDAVLQRLIQTWDASVLAGSTASLIERLRVDLEAERDRLAQDVFERLVAQGRIEFRLRADRTDYELPHELLLEIAGKPQKLTRTDDYSDIEKSLLAPALRTPDLNAFEALFCGYLDEQKALRWWHRNVAKTQYGLQGWKRHKVYPDFVLGFLNDGTASRVVLLETKGVHLAGSEDTGYKQELLARLTAAFCDERFRSAGELELDDSERTALSCDLVFDRDWRSVMDERYFDAASQLL